MNPYHDQSGQFTSQEKAVWTKTGGNKGSNPGGTYTKNGEKHYVKFPHAQGQIAAEEAADKIHELMGIETMNHAATDVDGKLASVSKWKDVTPLGSGGWKNLNEKQVQQAANAFVASALTKNWDVVGLVHDNIGKTKDGNLAIIDTGGSFEFRAQGGHKDFDGDALPEIKAMLSLEKTSGRVYAPLLKSHPEAFQKAAERLKSLTPDQLKATIPNMSPKIQQALLARRESILKHFKLME